MPAYKRVLLKLSGEALMGDDAFGINPVTIDAMVSEIAQVVNSGVELAIVIGGGNIFRGVAGGAAGMDRATADYMGMLATMMNSLALQDALRQKGVEARVQSALRMDQVVEPYIRPRAIRAMSEGKVVIFAAGTGNPFFTTDTAAALRGAEMGVEVMLKATKVDGIYSADPVKDPTATLYKTITFDEALIKNLQVMDATAFALCRDRKLPIKVFSILKPGALMRVVQGEPEGTDQKMQKSLEALKTNLAKIRSGRANPGILEHIQVDYYGNPTPLSQVASLGLADARTINVQPFEKTMVAVVEKAIRDSDLGLNPASQGTVIRVPMPALTEERRRELTKVVKSEGEDTKIAVRNLRRDANEHLKRLTKDKEISEDEERRATDEIQKMTDKAVVEIDKIIVEKEKEIMTV